MAEQDKLHKSPMTWEEVEAALLEVESPLLEADPDVEHDESVAEATFSLKMALCVECGATCSPAKDELKVHGGPASLKTIVCLSEARLFGAVMRLQGLADYPVAELGYVLQVDPKACSGLAPSAQFFYYSDVPALCPPKSSRNLSAIHSPLVVVWGFSRDTVAEVEKAVEKRVEDLDVKEDAAKAVNQILGSILRAVSDEQWRKEALDLLNPRDREKGGAWARLQALQVHGATRAPVPVCTPHEDGVDLKPVGQQELLVAEPKKPGTVLAAGFELGAKFTKEPGGQPRGAVIRLQWTAEGGCQLDYVTESWASDQSAKVLYVRHQDEEVLQDFGAFLEHERLANEIALYTGVTERLRPPGLSTEGPREFYRELSRVVKALVGSHP